MILAPETYDGKKKIFEEFFVSPFQKDTESQALQVLDSIRESHPTSSGWVEFETGTGIYKLPNGKWFAQRHHAKYE